ncbi:hypothetical protein YC2023_109558 [Brassica napus]
MSAIISKDCDIMWQRSSRNAMDTCLFVALRHKAELQVKGLGVQVLDKMEIEKRNDALWQGKCSGTVYVCDTIGGSTRMVRNVCLEEAMRRHVNRNTPSWYCLEMPIVGSARGFPHGIIYPVEVKANPGPIKGGLAPIYGAAGKMPDPGMVWLVQVGT